MYVINLSLRIVNVELIIIVSGFDKKEKYKVYYLL